MMVCFVPATVDSAFDLDVLYYDMRVGSPMRANPVSGSHARMIREYCGCKPTERRDYYINRSRTNQINELLKQSSEIVFTICACC